MSLGGRSEAQGGDESAGSTRPATVRMRALAHPTRLRILSLVTGSALTAAEVARELGLTHANASYHLRHLEAAGHIQVVGEERINGGVARRYRYLLDEGAGDPPPGPAGLAQRTAVHDAMASELRRRSRALRPTPGHAYTADAEVWVDPQTWLDIRARIAAAGRDLHEAARPPRTPGTVRVNATVALFELEPDPR